MSLAVRVLVFIFSIITLVLAAGALGVALGWDPAFSLASFSEWVTGHALGTGLFGLVSLTLGVLGLVVSLQPQDQQQALVKETSLGTIRISLGAMETLIKRAAAEIDGVRGIHPTLHNRDGKIHIQLALEVAPDTNIPQLADKVQTRVVQYLAQTVGINEINVGLTVREISSTLQKARVK